MAPGNASVAADVALHVQQCSAMSAAVCPVTGKQGEASGQLEGIIGQQVGCKVGASGNVNPLAGRLHLDVQHVSFMK